MRQWKPLHQTRFSLHTMQQSTLPKLDLAPFHIKSKELPLNINEFKMWPLPTMRDLLSRLLRPLNDAVKYVSFYFFIFWVSDLLIFSFTNFLFFQTYVGFINWLKKDKERATALKLSVTPKFRISFPYTPIKNEIQYELSLPHDLVNFLFHMSFLLQTTGIVGLYELPKECFYFFSQIFTKNTNIRSRKEASFVQFYHPLSFLIESI